MLCNLLSPGVFLTLFFAILCAMAVFGYLYNSRSACWTHALPMRREALFTTQYLAGLSFLLLPQLAVAGLTAAVEVSFLPMDNWGAALSALGVWLLAQSGICLFFFSFAAFCAMFTGHILALPAFYCILNVLADVIYTLLDGLFHEFFYGYAGSAGTAQIVEYLTPAYALKDAVILFGNSEEGQRFRSPGTVAVYAAVGVALALISLYVYRRRHAETAGDVVAIPLVRPLFKYGVSFCAGLCLGMFSAMFFGWRDGMAVLIASILVWTVIGCFAAEMLLKKSFRVFKAWRGAAVMAAVMLLLCLGCTMDLFGVETRVPQTDGVESLKVTLDLGYPGDSGSSYSAVLTEPENIQKFIDLHRAIVAALNEYGALRAEVRADVLELAELAMSGGEDGGMSLLELRQKLDDLAAEQAALVDKILENMNSAELNAQLETVTAVPRSGIGWTGWRRSPLPPCSYPAIMRTSI